MVSLYFRASLAPSTTRSYESAKKRYLQFCANSDNDPLPASEEKLCSFVTYLADSNLTHQTIKCYLSAVRHLQIAMNKGDPHISSMPKLEHVLRGIKKEQSKKHTPAKSRLPITPNILTRLREVWEEEPHNYDYIMLWAACCTCYFGFLRSGEICSPSDEEYDPSTHLNFSDLAVDSHDNTSVIALKIKTSKTDPFRQGVTIYLGTTNTKLCPVQALLAYIAVRGDKQGALFSFSNHQLLTRARFVKHLRLALSKAGIDPDLYAGHSFRIGAATVACTQGIEDSTIMTLGRWKSNAYQRYIRIPQEHLAQISSRIASPIPARSMQIYQPNLEEGTEFRRK